MLPALKCTLLQHLAADCCKHGVFVSMDLSLLRVQVLLLIHTRNLSLDVSNLRLHGFAGQECRAPGSSELRMLWHVCAKNVLAERTHETDVRL